MLNVLLAQPLKVPKACSSQGPFIKRYTLLEPTIVLPGDAGGACKHGLCLPLTPGKGRRTHTPSGAGLREESYLTLAPQGPLRAYYLGT